jgi:hypothetical protein
LAAALRLRALKNEYQTVSRERLEQLKTEIELTRLREAVGGAMAAFAVRQNTADQQAVANRRAEAVAALYRRLAKLETTYVSVTNPVLLPGESFELPAELLPDTLKWESWKEFGDSAFAFAEAFNQDRIFLDDPTCRDLTALVGLMREAMTSTIYPSLLAKNGADAGEAKAQLRTTLEQIGKELQEARGRLERTFRENE